MTKGVRYGVVGGVTLFVAVTVAIVVGVRQHSTSHHPPFVPPADASGGAMGSDVAVPPLPTGPVVKAPGSVSTNCGVDATATLQSWINHAPNNSTLSFAPGACYRLDGTLLIAHRARLRFEGNGATLRAFTPGNRTRAQVRIRASRDITIQDLVVRGANPHAGANADGYVASREAQHAFDLGGVTGVLLLRVRASDLFGDFVYIGVTENRPSQDVTVSHSTFQRSGRQGISITGGVNVVVADNEIGGAPRSLFDIEANTTKTSIQHIFFVRNVTGAARNFWLANKGRDAHIGDIHFVGNRMTAPTRGLVFVYSTGAQARGPFVFDANDLIAQGQVTDEGAKGGFFFANAKDVTIRGNSVRFAPGMTAIELRATHGVTAAGNRFSGDKTLLVTSGGSSDYHVS